MLNLFLLVTLQQFEEFDRKKKNPVQNFEILMDSFRNAWNKYSSEKDNGYRIKNSQLTNFILDLEWKKLKFPEHKKIEYIKKFILDLKLLK
jgi:hypothetical protein